MQEQAQQLQQLYAAWGEADEAQKEGLSVQIKSLESLLDPDGSKRQMAATAPQIYEKALNSVREREAAGPIERAKAGATQTLDAWGTSLGQMGLHALESMPMIGAGSDFGYRGDRVEGIAETRADITADYQGRTEDRAPMVNTPAGMVGQFGTEAVPYLGSMFGAGLAGAVVGGGIEQMAAVPAQSDETFLADKAEAGAIGGLGGATGYVLGKAISGTVPMAREVVDGFTGRKQPPGELRGPQWRRPEPMGNEQAGDYRTMLGSDAPPRARIEDHNGRTAGADEGMPNYFDEFGIHRTPARDKFAMEGDTRGLSAEEAARRLQDSDIQTRVNADRRLTQQSLEESVASMPGGGRLRMDEGDLFNRRLSDEVEARTAAEKEAWEYARNFRDDPALDPDEASEMLDMLRKVVEAERPTDTMGQVKSFYDFLGKKDRGGFTVGGIDGFRKDINQYIAQAQSEPAQARIITAAKRALDERLATHRPNDSGKAVDALRSAVKASAHKFKLTKGTEVNPLSGKRSSRVISEVAQKLESGESPEVVIDKLIADSRKARKFLEDLETEDIPEPVRMEMREAMRKRVVDRMVGGKFRDDGGMMADEGYKAVSNDIERFLNAPGNRRMMEELFTPEEIAKWERMAMVNRALVTPANIPNVSGTAGGAEYLGRLADKVPLVSNMERMMVERRLESAIYNQ